jgi:hypothetical protein
MRRNLKDGMDDADSFISGGIFVSVEDGNGQISEARLELRDRGVLQVLYANSDELLHQIENATGLSIGGRSSHLSLRGTQLGILQEKKNH